MGKAVKWQIPYICEIEYFLKIQCVYINDNRDNNNDVESDHFIFAKFGLVMIKPLSTSKPVAGGLPIIQQRPCYHAALLPRWSRDPDHCSVEYLLCKASTHLSIRSLDGENSDPLVTYWSFHRNETRSQFHKRLFHRIPNSMVNAFCSHPSGSKIIVMKWCIWRESSRIVACGKFCSDMINRNGFTLKYIFHRIYPSDGKIVHKMDLRPPPFHERNILQIPLWWN